MICIGLYSCIVYYSENCNMVLHRWSAKEEHRHGSRSDYRSESGLSNTTIFPYPRNTTFIPVELKCRGLTEVNRRDVLSAMELTNVVDSERVFFDGILRKSKTWKRWDKDFDECFSTCMFKFSFKPYIPSAISDFDNLVMTLKLRVLKIVFSEVCPDN